MEREQSTEALIALGIAVVLFILVLVLVVVISTARRNASKRAILRILNDQCESSIKKVESEVAILKNRLEILEKENA